MSILDKMDRDNDAIEARFYDCFEEGRVYQITMISHDQNLEEAVYKIVADFGNDAGNEFETMFATITDSGDAEIFQKV